MKFDWILNLDKGIKIVWKYVFRTKNERNKNNITVLLFFISSFPACSPNFPSPHSYISQSGTIWLKMVSIFQMTVVFLQKKTERNILIISFYLISKAKKFLKHFNSSTIKINYERAYKIILVFIILWNLHHPIYLLKIWTWETNKGTN